MLATLEAVGETPSPRSDRSRRRLLLILALGVVASLGVIAGVLVAVSGSDAPDFVGSSPPARLVAPAFSLEDESGTTLTREDIGGRVMLLTFLSTNCRAQCPPTASTIRVAMEGMTAEERTQIAVVAISIDPEFDNAAAAVTFLDERRLTGMMSYLIGTVEELQPVWDDYAVLSSVDSGSSDNHSVPVRIFDGDGVWVASLRNGDDLNPENLMHDLREALPN